ncbi:5'-methylthioadenosine/S-adenosylhomocysteine nucleosidase [Sinorhizobium meliloti WSM1022]|jgi:adenosylhomocysteine nucleosidase|uniref:MTA/SAH nucleosidase P46 includes: 5'-methylthioadenosine nucleosidase and S-adenosylhomocysteine nucleosidase n=2 Tax=Rhizobium meliloti TaxID=382 RepID=Q92SQ2_RHIME|nr:5'-methylthioadenosine/S-adenosylhomocysteine nucleosidase [Sinorhizobium meliloti]PST29342.1 5'-methylthioadenosine/S-adenosylhomocysteine nucleosidase [Mesorhizobium loti]TWB00043.1 adenosylhomocysteine nucleosidase [Ensifer sp. SEMIA 134]TWB34481.1 adenosylhomocysteine nucleosidase [Ensifer sp. SEMIA 135]AEG06314.1 5'-methylthioadenosine/S-adenosylhomocysteine nucleosidase [Sinorhizobium meliloti BL225C]AEG55347.1 5'-methylthioadenosine/S-adenosylhomocysteine nucleosidase [Sinorhizobium 
MSFELKAVAGRNILYVMAVDAEYGPCLRGRIVPLMTGVGPVEAAVSLTRALAELDAKGSLPDLVVSLGSAGSATLEQTEVYQAISVAYRDMDASPLGFEKGATPFLDLPAVVKLPLSIPGVRKARLSTGADIVSGNAYEQIDADMVEMETFAVLRACQAFGVPLIGLRGISDGKAELKHVGDWTEYLHVIDEKLAAAVDQLEAALEKGEIQL